LAILIIIGIGTIAVFNIAGVNVTKHISSLARSIIDVSRTVLVWIISITITVSTSNPNFKWENTRFGAISIELAGFLVLVAGNLIYNEIVILPFIKPPAKELTSTDDEGYSLHEPLKNQESK